GLAVRSSVPGFMRAAAALALAAMLCAAPGPGFAQNDKADKGGKLPRYASLRSGEVNVRTGPGPRYPVEWVLTRRNMPVEVIAEFDTWRQVRDRENTLGWVHQAMLSAQRYVMIMADEMQPLLRRPDDAGPAVAMLEPGVVAQLLQCDPQWCRLQANRVSGWVKRKSIWGVYPDEDVK
ncbi:MAG: SH3 domain-containing protein, partial [Rhodospirillales bacterium]